MIVIHVGLKKCGSASIQSFLSENREELKKLSLDYPEVGRRMIDGHHKAHRNFAYEIQGAPRFQRKRGTLLECGEARLKSGCRVMALSSEVFEEADTREAHKVGQLLGATGSEDFRIYVVIRDLGALMLSSYAQKIKYGVHHHDFDTFFAARTEKRRTDCFDTVRRWAGAYGWRSMEVRMLDGANLYNGDLIDDFLAVCGITGESEKSGLIRTGVQNTSPGWRVLEATRALVTPRGRSRPSHPLRSLLEERAGQSESGRLLHHCTVMAGEARGWNADRGRYLTREQAHWCHQTYRDAILRLNEALPYALPMPAAREAADFPERKFLPDTRRIPVGELSRFYDDVWDLLKDRMPAAPSGEGQPFGRERSAHHASASSV